MFHIVLNLIPLLNPRLYLEWLDSNLFLLKSVNLRDVIMESGK